MNWNFKAFCDLAQALKSLPFLSFHPLSFPSFFPLTLPLTICHLIESFIVTQGSPRASIQIWGRLIPSNPNFTFSGAVYYSSRGGRFSVPLCAFALPFLLPTLPFLSLNVASYRFFNLATNTC